MRTVHKYIIGNPTPEGLVLISMPIGAQILRVDTQNNIPVLWARINSEQPYVQKHFRVAGTGQNLDHGVRPDEYVGTFFLDDLVFHLFRAEAPLI
jgi:hypothetical protein